MAISKVVVFSVKASQGSIFVVWMAIDTDQ